MSLDEHIRRLTDSITDELRAPIQESLRRLLSEVLASAEAEHAASEKFWEESRATLETQIATLRDDYEKTLAAAESQRDELLGQHAAELVALRTQQEDDRHAIEQSLRDELVRQNEARMAEAREEALSEAREQVLAERQAAEAALKDEHGRERLAAVQALRDELTSAHEAQLASMGNQHEAERQAFEQALREELAGDYELRLREGASAHEQAIARVRDEVTAEVGQAVLHEARKLADEERAASEQSLREELAREFAARLREVTEANECALARVREEVTAEVGQAVLVEARRLADEEAQASRLSLEGEQKAAEQALREELTREHEARLSSLREMHGAAMQAMERSLRQDYETRLGEAQPAAETDGERVRPANLLEVVARLDEARTLSEELGQLIDRVSNDAGRAAIFLVNGERMRPWRTSGFEAPEGAEADLSIDNAGPIGLAVRSGRAVTASEDAFAALSLPEWLRPGPGLAGLAVPITVGGRTVAVLYADEAVNGEAAARNDWPEAAEILARHAGRCLEVLTIARFSASRPPQAVRSLEQPQPSAALGPEEDTRRQEESARRYARLLISEVKLYNETTVKEGRQHGDILARLGPEIERARRLYEEKIPAGARERAGWFDEELVRTLAGGEAGLLGQVT